MAATRRATAVGAVVLLTGSLMGSPAASASQAPEPTTVAKKLVTPLSMVVAGNGTAYVSQNFAGLLTAVPPGGKPRVVYAAKKGTEVGALSASRGKIHFATTKGRRTALWSMRPGSRPTKVADLWQHERTKNPDGDVAYGFSDLDAACAAQMPPEVPAAYTGILESHPYATAVHKRRTYVADAAGNTILSVKPNGKVKTVAVLPPVPVVVTAEAAAANGLPACTVGHTFNFESVPTDVEVGKGGWLYVTLLPGGPEDGSIGAQGRLVKVKARTGKVREVASGFAGATGVAVARNGDVYVAQLFGGQVSRIKAGSTTARPWAEVMMPAAVEWARGDVYVSAQVLSEKPKGVVLRY